MRHKSRLIPLVLPLLAACAGSSGGDHMARLAAAPSPAPATTTASGATATATAATVAPAHSSVGAVDATPVPAPKRSPSASPAVSRTASAPPAAADGTVTLDDTDSGRTVRVDVGAIIRVRLPGGPSGGYHQPASTGTAVQRTAAAGGYPTAQPATATFVARHHGTADLTSTTDYTCLHTTPRCLPPQRTWVVHVVVSG